MATRLDEIETRLRAIEPLTEQLDPPVTDEQVDTFLEHARGDVAYLLKIARAGAILVAELESFKGGGCENDAYFGNGECSTGQYPFPCDRCSALNALAKYEQAIAEGDGDGE